MGTIWCCNKPTEEMEYGDYIFNHEQLLKIQVSNVLANTIHVEDFISLRVCLNNNLVIHTCKVHYKTVDELYVSFVQTEELNKIEYIEKIISL